jgi:predicted enzyme related to lactoylglutathione lyase
MTTIDKHDAGTFCWLELATTDRAKAVDFYTKLFGWKKQDDDLPTGGVYTTFKLGDRPVGAAYDQSDEERSGGIPAHWNLYVSVDDVDKSAAVAQSAGGTILMQPFDVMDIGRMAVLADPTGALINLWQPGTSHGFAVRDEHGSFSWPELLTSDADTAAKFYGELFGWTTEVMEAPEGPPYTIFSRNGKQVAGMMAMPEIPPNWMIYFEVSDAERITKNVGSSGGQVQREPMAIPGVGTFAVFSDPQGAAFAILQSENRP